LQRKWLFCILKGMDFLHTISHVRLNIIRAKLHNISTQGISKSFQRKEQELSS